MKNGISSGLLDEYLIWVKENTKPEKFVERVDVCKSSMDFMMETLSGNVDLATSEIVSGILSSDFADEFCDKALANSVRDFLRLEKPNLSGDMDELAELLEGEVVESGVPSFLDVSVKLDFSTPLAFSFVLDPVGGFDWEFDDDVSLPHWKDENLRELLSLFSCAPKDFAEAYVKKLIIEEDVDAAWERAREWVDLFSEEMERKMRGESSWVDLPPAISSDVLAEVVYDMITKPLLDSDRGFRLSVLLSPQELEKAVVALAQEKSSKLDGSLPASERLLGRTSALFSGKMNIVSPDKTFKVEKMVFDLSLMSFDQEICANRDVWDIEVSHADFFALSDQESCQTRSFSFRHLPGSSKVLYSSPIPHFQGEADECSGLARAVAREGLEWMVSVVAPWDPKRNGCVNGMTLLSYMLVARRLEAVKDVLSKPWLDVNAKNSDGSTALHFLTGELGGLFLGKMLDAGADASILDNRGESPADRCCWNPDLQSLVMMRLHGGQEKHPRRVSGTI